MRLRARLEIWKYKWQRQTLHREMRWFEKWFWEEDNPNLPNNWYSKNPWALELKAAAIQEIITRETIWQAEKFDIPVPPRTDKTKWEDGIDNTSFLNREAIKELRLATRKVRHQTIEWRVKVTVGILTAIGLAIALATKGYKLILTR